MREIKFRAWNGAAFNPQMIKWDELKISKPEDILIDQQVILMQYTGLKDKNGKEIYEGDIIRNLNSFGCETSWGFWKKDNFPEIRKVIFDSAEEKFKLCYMEQANADKSVSGYSFVKGNEPQFEIIGNIHENPELTK